MTAAVIDFFSPGAIAKMDLDAPLTIMLSLRRRDVSFGYSPRRNAATDPKEGGQVRVQTESTENSAPTPEMLNSWLQAVAERQDRDAFARLHGFFAPRLASFLSRAGLSPTQAEDIVQETMIAVWRKAALYDQAQGGVSTWVFVIARNLRIDFLRRTANREMLPIDDWDQIDDHPTGEEGVLATERESQVRKALTRLSPEQIQILQQAYFAEKPQSAIARDLGVPLGTVKSRVRLALARLRKLLEETP
jgi:RNA polymerase sigma-70 factor (ECF subfamily)